MGQTDKKNVTTFQFKKSHIKNPPFKKIRETVEIWTFQQIIEVKYEDCNFPHSGVNPPNFFLRKKMLLSLSVSSMRKYCLYFEMAKLKSKNYKNEDIKVW